jgi:tol-pal system protein YbgF
MMRTGIVARMRWRLLVPFALVATGGCFATREDVRVLQDDLTRMQAAQRSEDSAHRAALEVVIEQIGRAQDTLRVLSGRTAKWQGDVSENLYSLGQQLIQVEELTGQSQKQLSVLRGSLEAQHATVGSAPGMGPTPGAAAPGGTSPGDTARGGGGPGPDRLFQLALDQLRRGSTGAARAGLTDLLRQYPNSDVAPDAHLKLAQTYAQEGNATVADSGYQDVIARYPTLPIAATALYLHAGVLSAAGKTQPARDAYQDVIRKYPRSDEAVLAKDRLRDLK